MSQQLALYREYQTKLSQAAGTNRASSIVASALYIVSTGASDFVQNYYINPLLYKSQSPEKFSSLLISIFSNFIRVSKHIFMDIN